MSISSEPWGVCSRLPLYPPLCSPFQLAVPKFNHRIVALLRPTVDNKGRGVLCSELIVSTWWSPTCSGVPRSIAAVGDLEKLSE